MHSRTRTFRTSALAVAALAAMLSACTTVGPDFTPPQAAAPADWNAWRSGDDSLRLPAGDQAALQGDWWRAFGDPVLDELERRALAASPDLQTAALHFAQARVQRGIANAQGLPQIGADAQAMRQRQSEFGAGSRMFGVIGNDRESVARLLGEPFTLYQSGFDLSWELDLWGRVKRSLEAADAEVANQAALLDLAHLGVVSDVAQAYCNMRLTQRQIALTRADIEALGEQLRLVDARTSGGITSHVDLARQRGELEASQARLPALLAQEADYANRIALLLGERPGALAQLLKADAAATAPAMPEFALGLPSEIALRRPDIRSAEARLHRATANIGVAKADLYPSIRLGGSVGLESFKSGEFFNLASGTYGFGPSISLPLFDGGHRRRTVELRELEQKEAAVAWQKTVLQAWGEIDGALNTYAAERQRNARLAARAATTREAHELATARYRGGIVTWLDVLDTQRNLIQSRRDLADSDSRLAIAYVTINKAIGNAPVRADGRSDQ